ncbi:MAG: YidC/Oxa1 family membrane protein insertase [Treponema sp.]|nr:YidC/Oxa1 family membrane protein insertase [Treponema sp.]
MANFLYTLIIYPLTLLIEASYMLVYEVFDNVGFAVIGVSVAVSLLCLPLYIVAEKWQQIERNKQKQMEGGIARIKKTFKGDEQYMILTTFYKQNHYHPLMALRSSFGLLIQVPFFIAAYSFLSSMPALQGQSFAFIRDMGKPDALFYLGSFPINILPIAMTVINIAGSAVYTKGFKLKEKLPIYAMALIFLAILYDSPAGLVLYWTMNNVFSLVKNIFYKIKRPLFVLYILASLAAAYGIYYVLFRHNGLISKRSALAVLLALTFFTPLLVKAAAWALKNPLKNFIEQKQFRHAIFLTSAFSLALMTGLVIPSNVISSSVLEFVDIDNIANPNFYVYTVFLQSLGLFAFWFCCVYFLFGKRIQTLFAFACAALLFWAATNVFVFGGSYGDISRVLIFEKAVADSAGFKALNIAVLLLEAAAILALCKFFKKALLYACVISLIAFVSIGTINAAKIQIETSKYSARQVKEENAITPVFHFSKTGKNVVVIMADRAENAYTQAIFDAYPDLKEAFKDWTLYSHALSYDSHTLLGAPPLYGGYEYTPLNMNARASVPLKEKNNEALLLMPRVFTEQADFSAQAADLSWANYSWIPDMSICDPYPKIKPLNLEGKYTSKWISEHPKNVSANATSKTIKRNFLWFALFKEAPAFLRESIYAKGSWWSSDENEADLVQCISRYSVLDYLPNLTDFGGNQKGNFILLQSMLTHTTISMQAPDYLPSKNVINLGKFSNGKNNEEFASNIALYKTVAKWIDFLKENGCYDNTRIIIVADHGAGRGGIAADFFVQGPVIKETGYDLDQNHPLLMVKDFTDSGDKNQGKAQNAPREFTVDNRFMTNADTPYLAFEGIVENPVNPWTKKPIKKRTDAAAYGVVAGGRYDPGKNGVYKFDLNGIKVYDVFDDMSKASNWKERKE